MNQGGEGNNADDSANPMKRRRGRPRKHPGRNVSRGENAGASQQNLNHPANAAVNGNQPHQENPNNNGNDAPVGLVVQGVIDASFDAGYLLSVTVANSDKVLRGVVFKQGQYAPIVAQNDIAPNVPMIRRNEVPLPAQNSNQVHGRNPRSRDRNEQHINSGRNGTANLGTSRAKHVPPVSIQSAHPVPSDKVVPVVLQPVNLPNGGAVASQPAPVMTSPNPLESSKGKQVEEAAYPSNGSGLTNQVQTVGNQVPPLQSPSSDQWTQHEVSMKLLADAEAKAMQLPNGLPFENLLTEVIDRVQPLSPSDETEMNDKKDDSDTDQPLSIEPLQAIQPDANRHLSSLPKPFDRFRTGKMTELLRAVQENMENQSPQTDEPATGSIPGAESDLGNKEHGHFWTGSV